MSYVPIAAKWAEEEWGYIRNKGVEYREGVMKELKDEVYIGFIADKPVAMFALINHSLTNELSITSKKLPSTKELMYVYVDKEYRGLGFGKQIIEKVKELACESKSDRIFLDTLKPSLNRFYEKHGAVVACEGTLYSHPTDVLIIRV